MDWYFIPWAFLAFVVLILTCIGKPPFWWATAYCMGSSVLGLMVTDLQIHPTVSIQIKNAMAIGLMQLGTFMGLFLLWRKPVGAAMEWLFWVNLGLTIFCALVPVGFHGLGFNLSLNGTLLAIQLSFAVRRTPWAALPALVAIGLTGSTMGILAILVAGTLTILFMRTRYTGAVLALVGIVVLVLVERYGARLTDLNGRMAIWELALRFMEAKDSWIFGSGFGSWAYLGPKLQMDSGQTTNFFVHLHNDFLQLFFEVGLVGLSLWAIAFAHAFRKSLGREDWVSIFLIIAFLVSCVGNFPTRLPFTMVCLAGLFWRVYRAPTERTL